MLILETSLKIDITLGEYKGLFDLSAMFRYGDLNHDPMQVTMQLCTRSCFVKVRVRSSWQTGYNTKPDHLTPDADTAQAMEGLSQLEMTKESCACGMCQPDALL